MDEIKKEIQARLQELEQEERVCIFYACESGGRAWGFLPQIVIMMCAFCIFTLKIGISVLM